MGYKPIFFQIFLSCFNIHSIDRNELLGDCFYWNPLDGNYVYPPFFSNTMAKEEKSPFQRALKPFSQEQFKETFFLGHLRVYWIRKTKNIAVRTFVPQIFYYDQTNGI